MNHRIGRWVFALGIGLVVAFASYRWITNPAPRNERQLQEAVVEHARTALQRSIGQSIEFVDPLAPDRKVGKSYVYRAGQGWEVSGYYRRDDQDRWRPYLMALDAEINMIHLRVQDPDMADSANPLIEVLP